MVSALVGIEKQAGGRLQPAQDDHVVKNDWISSRRAGCDGNVLNVVVPHRCDRYIVRICAPIEGDLSDHFAW
jgi:hypothetical protein